MKNKIKLLGMIVLVLSFSFKPINEKRRIIIDAAHGGKDKGAVMGDASEKNIVENISMKIKELNKNDNVEIVLLRDEDTFMELNKRVEKINTLHPDLMISLHVNTSTDMLENGIEGFVSRENSFYNSSFAKANNLVNAISNEKLANRKVQDRNTFINKNSNCPAVLLELGYLSNQKDKNYLTSEAGQTEIALKIVECLKN